MNIAKKIFPFLLCFLQLSTSAQTNFIDSLLTSAEIRWLDANRENIVYAPNPGWPPCDFVDESGNHRGIVADYISIFEEKLGIRFQRIYLESWNDMLEGLKSKTVDFVGGIHQSDDRESYLNFTDRFLTVPLVLVVRSDFDQELTKNTINTMTLACPKGYASCDYMRQTYPGAEIIESKDDLEALFKTSMGMVDGAIVDLMVASYLVEHYGFSKLGIVLELGFSWKLSFGIREDYPHLQSILNKLLASISEEEKKAIFEKWIQVPGFETKNFFERNVKLIVYSLIIAAILLVMVVIIIILLRRMVRTKTRDLIATQQRIEASEKKFHTLFETMAQGVVYQDSEGHIVDANPAAQRILGLTLEQLQGRTSINPDWMTTREDGSELPGSEHPLMLALKTGKEVKDVVMKVYNPMINQHKCILVTAVPELTADNKIAQVYATFTDITAIKEAELKIRELNASLEQKVKERTDQLTAINQELSHEIEERVEIEKALLEAQQRTLAANKAKSEFLANMSHEIRTPMNAILGYAELLNLHIHEKTQKEFLHSIKTSGYSLLTLINDILDLSKVEAGKMELQYDYVNTKEFFAEFQQVFAFKTNEKKLEFITTVASGVPNFIYIDGPRLRQVILNLAGNAIKFTDKGSVSLIVTIENPTLSNTSGGKTETHVDLIIEVVDTGCGIDESYRHEIFNSFAQVPTNAKREGTGLGLPISKRLVELMGGCIEVVSALDEGSTFTVRIPDVACLSSYDSISNSSNINPHEVEFSKATILVVDDIEQNRKFIKDVLKETKLEILEAENGEIALSMLQSYLPQLIITDIRMPGINGFELLEEILKNENWKEIPVFAYSASVMKEQIDRIHKSKFAGLLIKPLQINDLYQSLMKVLPFRMKTNQEHEQTIKSYWTLENITDYKVLMNKLEGDLMKTHQSFSFRQPIGEVKQFGDELRLLGIKHKSDYLQEYGSELIDCANNFNIAGMLQLLQKYNDIVYQHQTIKEK